MKNILDNLTCVVRLLISHSRLSLNIVSIDCIIYILIILVRSDNFKKIIPGDYFQYYHINTLTNKINYNPNHPKSIKILKGAPFLEENQHCWKMGSLYWSKLYVVVCSCTNITLYMGQ